MDILTILPRLRFADENGKFDQIEYITGELKELVSAYLNEPIERVAEEAGDVLMSAWTLLWIIHRETGIHPVDVMLRVITKNKTRGYENESDSIKDSGRDGYEHGYVPQGDLSSGPNFVPDYRAGNTGT